MRQGMEDRRAFPLKPAPGSPSQQLLDHAREQAEGERGHREEGQRCHRGGGSQAAQKMHFTESLGIARAHAGHG